MYWYPIYAYFRGTGRTAQDAEDLTQGFFLRLVTGRLFAAADPERGRLRTFLLASARNFQWDAHDRAAAQKRGGGAPALPFREGEDRFAAEPVDELGPDRLFQRRWALAVLEVSLAALRAEHEARGAGELFEKLRPFLGFGAEPDARYDSLSRELGVPVGTLKNRVFRLRQRWREILFAEVGRTLENPTEEEIKSELAELLGVL
jgi:RNA polymerase sigma-70 factor (ECF subfamily)